MPRDCKCPDGVLRHFQAVRRGSAAPQRHGSTVSREDTAAAPCGPSRAILPTLLPPQRPLGLIAPPRSAFTQFLSTSRQCSGIECVAGAIVSGLGAEGHSRDDLNSSSLADPMAVCKMEALGVGNAGGELAGVSGRRGVWKPQPVMVSVKRWPSVASARVCARGGFRCNAVSGDGERKKNYDLNEVVEKVVHEEENQLPEEEKNISEPLPEGEPSPFSPAIDTDDTEAFQGEGVSKDSLVEPPRGLHEGAASASIGEGLGASEESALAADIGGSPKSGPGGHGRDWRVQSTASNAGVEKATSAEARPEQQRQMFGSSEASCDEGSSFMAEASILENDGGKSADDYKFRAQVFSESAIFFTSLKNRQSHSVV